MFKNRKLTVKVEKEKKNQIETITRETKTFEEKTEYVLNKLQRIGIKVFAGVCIYIALDTVRQVAVVRAETDG